MFLLRFSVEYTVENSCSYLFPYFPPPPVSFHTPLTLHTHSHPLTPHPLSHLIPSPPLPSPSHPSPPHLHSPHSHPPHSLSLSTPQNKRITCVDALFHPFLEDGRMRFHTFLCSCCHSPSGLGGSRHYCHDLEPLASEMFDSTYEKGLTTIAKAKGVCVCVCVCVCRVSRVRVCAPTLSVCQGGVGTYCTCVR